MSASSAFKPVSTLEDLRSLDEGQMWLGYLEYRSGDPEPGPERGRAYWHGWTNRARDEGHMPMTAAQLELARELLEDADSMRPLVLH